MNKYYYLGNIILKNKELWYYGDRLAKEEEDNLIYLLININRLQSEGWKLKNDLIRDFVLKSRAYIASFQEVNLN